ncbi:iron ABC transporter permease [Methanolobus sp. WCC1]|uniref:Cobalamin import system permease protein BtuC n=1 Tax=Methanolobus tindarius DSM 2278 TaxID=1090322 RepID=W9DT20_METTI|nr:iron ABC transporter permease [Methanolobus tindarius]ETA66837.1 ABC-type Fe3+-siderophore transport system, permease component [Methanolobus tindarius DSM 2278]
MNYVQGDIASQYKEHTGRKATCIIAGIALVMAIAVISIATGTVAIPVTDVVRTLTGYTVSTTFDSIVWNIRLPQILTAIVAGAGLAITGVVMQSILRNPLGSPFTLGISNASAFGAAFSIMLLGTGSTSSSDIIINNPYITTIAAFSSAMLVTFVILMFAKLRGNTSETMILVGVAMGSLFSAGTMFLQYFADETQLSSIVFWAFGDTARASWSELGLISAVVIVASIYFALNRWKYNAIDAGDDTAKGLGVDVDKVRIRGMMCASLVTATTVAFLGVIGFVGLICPHMARRLIGDDHRFLLTGSIVAGSLLLLSADTIARVIIQPYQLPVAVLTSFLGAPAFIYLILKGKRIR